MKHELEMKEQKMKIEEHEQEMKAQKMRSEMIQKQNQEQMQQLMRRMMNIEEKKV